MLKKDKILRDVLEINKTKIKSNRYINLRIECLNCNNILKKSYFTKYFKLKPSFQYVFYEKCDKCDKEIQFMIINRDNNIEIYSSSNISFIKD